MTARKKLKSPALQFTYDRYIKGRLEREAWAEHLNDALKR